ncbi:hypothetical protein [Nostoc sp.]|uniref:hypothetical protein n=1 Tax=Nostoc sp. TaxID=1180 RepID=UPI002FFC0CA6
MNTQEIQEFLTHFMIGITALYTIVMIVDFVVVIVHLWQKFTVNIEDTTSEKLHLESIDIKKYLKVKNQNKSTNRITSKPEPQPDNFISIDVDKIDFRTARLVRRFSLDFEEHLKKVPFSVRIETTSNGKRYVKQN